MAEETEQNEDAAAAGGGMMKKIVVIVAALALLGGGAFVGMKFMGGDAAVDGEELADEAVDVCACDLHQPASAPGRKFQRQDRRFTFHADNDGSNGARPGRYQRRSRSCARRAQCSDTAV